MPSWPSTGSCWGEPPRVRLIRQLDAAGPSSRVIAELLPCVHTGVPTAAQLELLTVERERIDRQAAGLLEARDRLDGVIAAAAAVDRCAAQASEGSSA